MPPNVEFKAKMHQIQFRLELHPRPCWRAYRAPSDTVAGFKGPADKVTGRERRESREEKGPLYFSLRSYAHDDNTSKPIPMYRIVTDKHVANVNLLYSVEQTTQDIVNAKSLYSTIGLSLRRYYTVSQTV